MKTKMMMLCLVLGSWGAFAQQVKKSGNKMDQNMAMFKDAKLGKAYEHYIHLKDALVASNQDEAKKAAGELQKSLASVDNGKRVADEAVKVSAAVNLDGQRKAFSEVSEMMVMLVKNGKLSMGMIYLEYCPMAKASWLSNEKGIKNPYFGEKMLKCGSVKQMMQ